MADYTEIAKLYLAAWNETDADARGKRVEGLWTAAGTYVDPMGEARGHEEINALIGAAQQQFPGFSFRLLGDVDGHHRQARFRWGLGPADRPEDADDPVVGFDVVTLDEHHQVVARRGPPTVGRRAWVCRRCCRGTRPRRRRGV